MLSKNKVLIVWRNEEQAVQIGDRLKKEGFEADLAGSYAEALLLLSKVDHCGVVLTEHYPPRINSYKLLSYIKEHHLEIPVIVMVAFEEEDVGAFFKKGAFDVIRKSREVSFLAKVPYAVKKAIEEQRLREEKRDADRRLVREKTISEALIQSVVNGVIFINGKGVIEKINVTLESLLGKEIVQLGKNICELPEDNLIRTVFLKPFEKEACWEIKQCAREECPMFGRRDCLCWFMESACIICSGITDPADRLNFLLKCDVYKKAQEKYYTEPVELEHNGKLLHIYRRNVMDEKGALIGEILDVVDMTPEKDFREQLRMLSITDPLTGLHNRRYITQRVTEEFHESKRYGRDLSLMIIDIDDFKKINDTYGHPAGDEVLRQLATVLERERRKSDVVGRYGGEEFVVIMPHTKKQEAAVMAERLRKKIKTHEFSAGPEKSSLTISIGVSSLTENIYDVDDLLKIADKALYQAKGEGKNKVVVL